MQTVTTSLDRTHDDDAEKRILFDSCSTVGLFDTTKAESINHFGAKTNECVVFLLFVDAECV